MKISGNQTPVAALGPRAGDRPYCRDEVLAREQDRIAGSRTLDGAIERALQHTFHFSKCAALKTIRKLPQLHVWVQSDLFGCEPTPADGGEHGRRRRAQLDLFVKPSDPKQCRRHPVDVRRGGNEHDVVETLVATQQCLDTADEVGRETGLPGSDHGIGIIDEQNGRPLLGCGRIELIEQPGPPGA